MPNEPIIITANLPDVLFAVYSLSYLFTVMLLIKVARWVLPG